nr:eukaryotic translation initiation factor 2d [Hymenolepis microstoma]
MLFLKPFKIRKHTSLRDTNKKKLIEQVIRDLAISAEDADRIFKDKVATEIKIHTNDRRDVMCYLFEEVPYVFIYEEQLYPTVFLLSSVSSTNVPVKYVDDALIERIYSGSGVVPRSVIAPVLLSSSSKPSQVFSLGAYSGLDSDIQVFKPLVVCVSDSNSKDCSVLHFANDKLFDLCPPHLLQSFKLGEKYRPSSTNPEQFPENTEQNENGEVGANEGELSGDDLLMYCFLHALCRLSESDLPLLVNVFYAKHMKSECPKGANLDIRKTSFKKVNVFLEKMQDEGFITIETVPKDIIRILSFNKKHPKIMELFAHFSNFDKLLIGDEGQNTSTPINQQPASVKVGNFYFGPPTFEEQRIITSKIAPLLASAGYRVGQGIAQSELCRIARSYIEANHLSCSEDRNLINVDKMLMCVSDANLFKEALGSTLSDPKFQITFTDLIKSLTKGLKVAYKVTYPPESGLSPLCITGNTLPKIKVYEALQNGKHVTRIGGLSNFGIDMKAFSRYIQTKLACSANLTEDPRSGNAMVVQAQGNHCIALSKLLTGK